MYYLMIKTHNKTGLKYLCKTQREDYEKYTGSGVYWKNHLKLHGNDFSTEVVFMSGDINEFSEYCLNKSIELDVVNSTEWANLILETGLDGILGYKHSTDSKQKISNASKGRRGFKLTEETKQKISKTLSGREMKCSPKGKSKTLEHRQNLSNASKGKPKNFSNNGMESMKAAVSERQKIKYKCSVCGKIGNTGQIGRYHKLCMENKSWNKIELTELQ